MYGDRAELGEKIGECCGILRRLRLDAALRGPALDALNGVGGGRENEVGERCFSPP